MKFNSILRTITTLSQAICEVKDYRFGCYCYGWQNRHLKTITRNDQKLVLTTIPVLDISDTSVDTFGKDDTEISLSLVEVKSEIYTQLVLDDYIAFAEVLAHALHELAVGVRCGFREYYILRSFIHPICEFLDEKLFHSSCYCEKLTNEGIVGIHYPIASGFDIQVVMLAYMRWLRKGVARFRFSKMARVYYTLISDLISEVESWEVI